jgi:dTDP-4-dehydrorhamnose reductase
MNVLVLGGTGMLGHKIFQLLRNSISDTWCTVRVAANDPWLQSMELFRSGNVIGCVDASDFTAVSRLLTEHRPKTTINCIGVIKQRGDAKAAIPSITINALLPHQLAELCQRWDGRLIHISTDCVFSGKKGNYSEEDFSDAEDLYGKTKFLGEVSGANALTLRTSIIGRELSHFKSLLEWFLGQNHKKIVGYTRAFYSGVTTNYMAALVAAIIKEQRGMSGLYQVASSTISKYELLYLLRDAYGLDVEIEQDHDFLCDRSMRGEKFEAATGYRCPPWPDLVSQLRNDTTQYDVWKRSNQER